MGEITLDSLLTELMLSNENLSLLGKAFHDMHVRCLILRVAESIPDDVEVLRCIDRAEEHVVVALQHEAVGRVHL